MFEVDEVEHEFLILQQILKIIFEFDIDERVVEIVEIDVLDVQTLDDDEVEVGGAIIVFDEHDDLDLLLFVILRIAVIEQLAQHEEQ